MNAIRLHKLLIRHSEGCTTTDADGTVWREVYLGNIPDITRSDMRYTLSVLAKLGSYKGDGTGDFGRVKVA